MRDRESAATVAFPLAVGPTPLLVRNTMVAVVVVVGIASAEASSEPWRVGEKLGKYGDHPPPRARSLVRTFHCADSGTYSRYRE
jgi:hypothetical protein